MTRVLITLTCLHKLCLSTVAEETVQSITPAKLSGNLPHVEKSHIRHRTGAREAEIRWVPASGVAALSLTSKVIGTICVGL